MISFNRSKLRSRIGSRFGGVAARIVLEWPLDREPPSGSAVSRWLAGKSLPRTESDFIALATALDLDPMSMLEINTENFAGLCKRILQASIDRSNNDFPPAFMFLTKLITPDWEWPPNFGGREWYTHEFQHQATTRRNFYESIHFVGSQRMEKDGDQVWHFAWSGNGVNSRWNPYGFVRLTGDDLSLYSFDGRIKSGKKCRENDGFLVETYFGQGSADFKIASLHDFEIAIGKGEIDLPTVRFE